MNILEQYRSLALEFKGVQNRVRNLIGNNHWLSDGEWKGSILRNALRGSMPKDVEIGRGFVVSVEELSNQIDVLISPSSASSLFRDGDFAIVSPSGFLGAIEVKTTADITNFTCAVEKLTKLARIVERRLLTNPTRSRFYGVFAYETTIFTDRALEVLQHTARGNHDHAINFVCLGPTRFIRWFDDTELGRVNSSEWRAYEFPDDRAFGYFLHNVLEATDPNVGNESRGIWVPVETKEEHRVGRMPLIDPV